MERMNLSEVPYKNSRLFSHIFDENEHCGECPQQLGKKSDGKAFIGVGEVVYFGPKS